jgi:dephospho-CoA kinase
MPNKLLTIGITGGIGAGKSIVCDIFRALGIHVYQADERAKRLMTEDENVVNQIRDCVWPRILHVTGDCKSHYSCKESFQR